MKKLSKKSRMSIGWTAMMTAIGTALLHQWEFFALGCASIAAILIANQCGLINDHEDK